MSLPLSDPIDSAALLRFIGGESPASERAAVEAWVAAAAGNRAELDRLEQAWRMAAEMDLPSFDTRALWERIAARLDEASVPASVASTAPALRPGSVSGGSAADARARRSFGRIPPSTRSGRGRTVVRAATILMLAAVAVLAFVRKDDVQEVVEEPVMRSYATKAGERVAVTLTDGSRVTLSGETTMRVPADFGEGGRDVHLDGEAYFEVEHDESNVFRVHTSRMVAEDLGTRFVVRAYASDTSEQVAVAEGMVAVAGNDSAESVLLNPNDIAHVSSTGVVSATRNVAIDRHFSWVDGVVQFDQDRLSDAATVIGRRFGVEIRISDSALARRRFTGSVSSATLFADLRGLALLLDASYESEGRTVTLTPRAGPGR